jgi:hypothetical protein
MGLETADYMMLLGKYDHALYCQTSMMSFQKRHSLIDWLAQYSADKTEVCA